MAIRWSTLPFAAALLLTGAIAAPAVAATAASPAAAPPSPPPFTATGAVADRGNGVHARPGTVLVTDPTDGPIAIDTTLYLPVTTPAPAVLLTHGFGGSKASVDAQAMELARAGMVVLAWSAPGFGRSGGTISLMSLDHEVPGGRQLIDHLAAQPEVLLDGPGDPRVGVAGGSTEVPRASRSRVPTRASTPSRPRSPGTTSVRLSSPTTGSPRPGSATPPGPVRRPPSPRPQPVPGR